MSPIRSLSGICPPVAKNVAWADGHWAVHGTYQANIGHDKMRSGADLRGGSPLVSFNHVIHPHFGHFLQQFVYNKIENGG